MRTAAIYRRSFFNSDWNAGFNESMAHEGTHRDAKAKIHQDQGCSGIQYMKRTTIDSDQRYHHHLKRDSHRGEHQGKSQLAHFPGAVSNKKICGHGREEDQNQHTEHSNEDAVCKRSEKIHLFDGIRIVDELQAIVIDKL